jgi:hypothetical protein
VRFFNTPAQQVRVNVYDSKGALVYNRDVTLGVQYSSIQIDLTKAESGTYTVEVKDAGGSKIGHGQVVVSH